jgi:hypothetical protein
MTGDRLCRNEWPGQGRAMKIYISEPPNKWKTAKPETNHLLRRGDDAVFALQRRVVSLMSRFHGGFDKNDFNFD